MQPHFKFIVAVAKHWGTLVTGGVVIGLISLWQNTGHDVPHYVYWSVAVIGLVVAFQQTWWDEHQQVVRLRAELAQDVNKQGQEVLRQRQEKKRELVQALTRLRATDQEVRTWLDITDNKWGMAPPAVKLLPDDWGNVVYIAGTVSDEVRSDLDSLSHKLSEANSLIVRFLAMPMSYRDQRLMPPANTLLNQAAPLLANVIAAVESYEKALR